MKRVLIIGGTTFIGPHVANEFLNNDFEVYLFHRNEYTKNDLDKNIQHILGDRKNIEDIKREINNVNPDLIVDMFAMCEEDINTLNSALDKKTKVVIISSCDVYKAYQIINKKNNDILQETPLTENSELRDILYPYRGARTDDYTYNYEKILVEKKASKATNIDPIIIRLSMIYGENDRRDRFGMLVKEMTENEKVIKLPKNTKDWIATKGYVRDIAYGIYLGATKGRINEIYNLGEEVSVTEEIWAKRVADILSWNGSIEFSANEIDTLNLKQDLHISTKKIREHTGYKEKYSLEDGIKNSIKK